MPKIQPYIHSLHSAFSPWELYQAVYSLRRKSFFLDSVTYQKPDQNYSYIVLDPFIEISMEEGRLCVEGEAKGNYPAQDVMKVLRKLLKKYAFPQPVKTDFFTGGVVGYWGYEMAPLFDKIQLRKKRGVAMPDLWLGFFREVIVFDHQKSIYYLVSCQSSKEKAQPALKRLRGLFDYLGAEVRKNRFSFSSFKPGLRRELFEKKVKRAKKYIEEGDIYQANLSQRFSFDYEGSALKLYDALRQINPSPFASFLDLGKFKIISSSPERLIRKRGNLCETRPIAGTRPRPRDSKKAVAFEKELRANAKECAEHIMLVDLERNDLGRVCDYHSVQVDELMSVEKYSHVMHLVSKVSGRLQKGKDALDLIGAIFPGGTITGCPKIRCMEIIDELEPVRRGIYTGSIGYIDFNGDMDLNIVIRTLLLEKKRGYLQVGAGIVHDSDPAKEYEETLHKAEALAQALTQASLSHAV